MTWSITEFEDTSALVSALSAHITDVLVAAVEQQGRGSFAVSGGTSPIPLYRALSDTDLPWADVIVSLVDERWVDESHADSNTAMIRRELLRNYASTARLVTMKTSAPDAFSAQAKINRILETSILPIDLVLLGMGTDGHTASLFPHAEGLEQALDINSSVLCQGIRVNNMAYTRMSLNLKALLGARHRVLFIQGEAKYKTLMQALQPGSLQDMPVRAVLHDTRAHTDIYYSPS